MEVSKFAVGMARRRIAANLKRLRRLHGLSQEAMAEQAEFHRTYVSQLERCVTNISIDGLERLALALGVDIQVLLTEPAGVAPTAPVHHLAVHEASPAFDHGKGLEPAPPAVTPSTRRETKKSDTP